MKEKLESVSRVAILLPLAHLLVCSLYILGYASTFRGNVSSLFVISDIFNVSLSGLAFIYIVGLLAPSSIVWFRQNSLKPRKPFNSNLAQADLAPSTKLVRYAETATIATFAFIVPLCCLLEYNDRLVLYNALLIGVVLLFAPVFWIWFENHGVSAKTTDYIWAVTVFVMSALGSGMSTGDYERRASFESLKSDYFACNDYIVIRKTGSYFIAARRNNRRLVLDEKCAVLFQFPKREPFSTRAFSFFGL